MQTLIRLTAAVTLLAVTSAIAKADCKCGGATPLVVTEDFDVVNNGRGVGLFAPSVHAPNPWQADGRRYPVHPNLGAAPPDSSLVPLLPGTVGQTYSRTSHPIPEDKHPRTAMLAVRDHGRCTNLAAQRMSGFRMSNGVWLFETNRPLTTWTEDIIRVEARGDPHDIHPSAVRFVRLIPGRLVYLDFQ